VWGDTGHLALVPVNTAMHVKLHTHLSEVYATHYLRTSTAQHIVGGRLGQFVCVWHALCCMWCLCTMFCAEVSCGFMQHLQSVMVYDTGFRAVPAACSAVTVPHIQLLTERLGCSCSVTCTMVPHEVLPSPVWHALRGDL
jgi:hypothetical protein